jgi:6-phosphogluconate dehydrogenase
MKSVQYVGVMGRNLLLNMADHGYSVAVYDINAKQLDALRQDAGTRDIAVFDQLKTLAQHLKKPRVLMLLVPAGTPVDEAIHDLLPHLDVGDIIMDGGNSHFIDTNRRAKTLTENGIHFLGVGISGGESGARSGPSIMPGGSREVYEAVRAVLEAIAAHVNGEPCVAYMGPDSAGHYVKMVHNGIEYGLMQLIAESYDILKTGLGFDNQRLGRIFSEWNQHGLNSFLIEITAAIFQQKIPEKNVDLIDEIQDITKQKGTGIWASADSMQLRIPIPTIDTAVAMRDLSVFKHDRTQLSQKRQESKSSLDRSTITDLSVDHERWTNALENALYASLILTYAQGMSLLRAASEMYHYQLDLKTVAKIWRGGCIIRSSLLDPIAGAYEKNPDLSTLLLDEHFGSELSARQADLRSIITFAIDRSIPVSGLMASLGYYGAYRRAWLPANLIQAQRDYFGAHTYERIDEKGIFHTEWGQTLREQAHAH